MNRNAGFTLLELLMAAAIIGVLIFFATQTFRRTSSDVRVQNAKTRARAVAAAAHRFKQDYPTATFLKEGDEKNFGFVSAPRPVNCGLSAGGISLQTLIDCGYLDYRQYAAEFRSQGEDGVPIFYDNFRFWFNDDNGQVCLTRANDEEGGKITDANTYCTDGERIWVQPISGD